MERTTIDFSARRTPWNGLGTDISSCRSVEAALWRAGLDWTVSQRPIQTVEEYPVMLDGFYANVRDTDDAPLGIVTSKYRIVQNQEAFEFTNSLVEEGVQFQQAGQFQNGRKVWILAKLPERYIISGEAINPYVVFITAHDGSSSLKVAMTPVRVICCNMLNLALRNATRTWSATHTGDINGKLQDARDTLFYAGIYMNELGKEIEVLNQQMLPDADVIDLVNTLLPMNQDTMTEVQIKNVTGQRTDLLTRYYNAPDLQVLPKNAFRFIQAVSDHATHAEPLRRRSNFQETLFARTIDGNALIDKAYSLVKTA